MYRVISPDPNKMDELVRLCADHAAFEQSTYSPKGKGERLKADIFSDSPKMYCKVIELDGAYIGHITWMRQYATWDAAEYLYMDCLYIDDAHRSKGLGVQLVNHMKTYATENEISTIQWQTPDFNTRAIKFIRE